MGKQYGVTPKGFILRRFDTIYADMADRVKEYAGIDITANPKSVLNLAIFFPFCDIVAQLHEENLEVYNSLHPSSAEGVALDDCCQFGNIKREAAAKTVYQISCNVIDGNTVKRGTIIAADTNPRHDLNCDEDTVVSREAFNELYVKPIVVATGQIYEITIDDVKYTYTAKSSEASEMLSGMAEMITDESLKVEAGNGVLKISVGDPAVTRKAELSNNLTTESVTGLVQFSTSEYGSIIMPDRTITTIISNLSTGFNWCENRVAPIAGRLEEEDWEYRQSYVERLYAHSSSMANSIRSYLLDNVNGVTSVIVYENDGDVEDAQGRFPHSVEVIVEGGLDEDIAYGILSSKAGGINTNGSVEVTCTGINDEPIVIRFNRPTNIYAWFKVELVGEKANIPKDYVSLVRDILMDAYGDIRPGTSIVLQEKIGEIYSRVAGVEYVYIYQYSTEESSSIPQPQDYKQTNITARSRDRILVSEDRIEVVINEPDG